MFRRLLFLDLVLFVLLVAGVVRIARDMKMFSETHRVDQIRPDSAKPLPKTISREATTNRPDWPDIAAHNPFSFDRSDVSIVVSPPAPQQPKRPKPLLFGTMMIGKDILALLSPGDSTTRSSRPVRTGEIFDGWTILEVQDKTVIVKWEEVKETLIMNDPTAQAVRDYTKTGNSAPAAVPVVTVGPNTAPATAAAAPAMNSSSPQAPTVSPAGKKQRIIHTPGFGDKVVDDDTQ